MDGHRFDDLTKKLAAGTSRRGFFKVLAGGVAAGVAAVRATGADAARPPRQPNGASCSRATDCASFTCADGVCCDKTCSGQCEACNLADREGTCSPVTGAPVGQRQACPGSGPCATTCDGVTRTRCDGTPPPDTTCAAPTCSGGWLTTHTCGSNGACVPTSTNCAPYGCDPSGTACATGCQSDAQCGGGSVCVGGQCQAALPLGGACTAGSQCQSGLCAQDVCCAEACDDPCYSCDLPGTVGFCTPTPGVQCDDGNPCTEHDVCQNNGDCEGTPIGCPPRGVCETATCNPISGGCDYQLASGLVCGEATEPCELPAVCDGSSPDCPPNQVQPDSFVCRPASCVDGLAVPASTCDGSNTTCPNPSAGEPCPDPGCSGATEVTSYVCQGEGGCVPTTTDCGLFLCVDGACPTTCGDNDDCVGAAHCAEGVCQGDRALGETCASPDDCISGHCIDGVCCDTTCDGDCRGCTTGTCQGTTGDACGGTGVCAGVCQTGDCVYPDETITCAEATCADTNTVSIWVCDGAGGCISEAATCAPYACANGACLTECSSEEECSDGAVCVGSACQPLAANGTSCTDPAECASGFCVDDVCCDTACDGECAESCATGTCEARTSGPCGQGNCAGTCDAGGACVGDGPWRFCGSSCVDDNRYRHTCAGDGTCRASSFVPCIPYACVNEISCATSCDDNTQCAAGYWCDNGECEQLGEPGDFCFQDEACLSGTCSDFGRCCTTLCDGPCEECNHDLECVPKTGRPTADCDGYDPDNVCSARCDGIQRDICSALPGSEVRCENRYCDGQTREPARFCDGDGACTTVIDEVQDCSPYLCSPSFLECRTSCTGDSHCIDGFHCTPDGACEEDVQLTEACDEPFDCGDGMACHESVSGESICCPAANCPPCQSYDATCTCVPNTDTRCGRQDSRFCCGGECCASTGPDEGGCQEGACPMVCLPIGEQCDQIEDGWDAGYQCCQDTEYEALCQYALTLSAPAGELYTNCCHMPGGSCTAGPGEPTRECCMVGSEESYCGIDGRCGGVGAFCIWNCPDPPGGCVSQCASGTCCNFGCCADGEHCRDDAKCVFPRGHECTEHSDCSSNLCCDGVCIDNDDEHCGGCNAVCSGTETCLVAYDEFNDAEVVLEAECKTVFGAPCTTNDQCFSGFCVNDICCDECGGGCGRPVSDNTPCDLGNADSHHCCGGVCTLTNTHDRCGACNVTCPHGDVCTNDLTCSCTVAAQMLEDAYFCQIDNFGLCMQAADSTLVCGYYSGVCEHGCAEDAHCQDITTSYCSNMGGQTQWVCTDEWVCAYLPGCGRSCVPVFPNLHGLPGDSCYGDEQCASERCSAVGTCECDGPRCGPE